MTTQLQYANRGIITPEMEQAALHDGVSPNWLCSQIAAGRCVIPKNRNRNIKARAIGDGLSTKINANIGTSGKHCSLKEELEKLKIATKYGADSIMDLSTGGNLYLNLSEILKHSQVMVGTVPIYTVVARKGDLGQTDDFVFDPDELFAEIETQAKMGVDFMTLHCAVTTKSIRYFDVFERTTGIVSRGGSLVYRYIKTTGNENPLYEHYDKILEVCKRFDVTISLGDGLRPGSGTDANDPMQIDELLIQGELVQRARNKGVQVMVEGPGHMPLTQIEMNMKLMKRICDGAPLYVLGPLTTDAAAGYDHIAGAIGGAIAASFGANFLCYVTPAEHLCLPSIDDVKQGVIASRIAAHSADVAKGLPLAVLNDLKLSQARFNLDWEKMFDYMLEPELA
ncbi:MAG: phosphomethylpyrimidine synthase ThiC, partial [Tenuifilum sp.]|uniref:phosphomethylpyrimidine synthase ThiC n=1 Tax=Tenuifilum sp. TaxID=2760880 RepID=UPI003C9ECA1B